MSKSVDRWPLSLELLAFFTRIHLRQTGQLGAYGEGVEKRAAAYSRLFEESPQSLKFKVGLVNVTKEFDLLDEEEAIKPVVLGLQARLVELGESEPVLRENLREHLFRRPPTARLLRALFVMATERECESMLFGFNGSSDMRVTFKSPGGDSHERIPGNLAFSVKGAAMLVEKIGFTRYLEFAEPWENPPADAEFQWLDSDRLEIRLQSRSFAPRKTSERHR